MVDRHEAPKRVPAQWYGRTRLERLAFEQVDADLAHAHILMCRAVCALCEVSGDRRDGYRASRGVSEQIDRMDAMAKALVAEAESYSAWLRSQGEPIPTLALTPPAFPIAPDPA